MVSDPIQKLKREFQGPRRASGIREILWGQRGVRKCYQAFILSDLAQGELACRVQAEAVRELLLLSFDEVEIVEVRTSGDVGNREVVGAFVSGD